MNTSSPILPRPLKQWLDNHAAAFDEGTEMTPQILPRLADAGLFRIGVPEQWGGAGGDVCDATAAIAAVSESSITVGFMFWGQRAFIEYLLQSENHALRERCLPDLLAGRLAGATGLSNAMKFLSGIEALQVRAADAHDRADAGAGSGDALVLHGVLPWATNLRPERFIVAAAVERVGGKPFIAALPADREGVERTADHDLIALRGSDTAAVRLHAVPISTRDIIDADASAWLPRVRPAFLSLQCALSIGLGRASLAAADAIGGPARAVLNDAIVQAGAEIDQLEQTLFAGVHDQRFITQAAELFRLRIRLSELVQACAGYELQASGGRAYHRDQPLGFARRWREAAFIPIVTPSITQLVGALRAQAGTPAAR